MQPNTEYITVLLAYKGKGNFVHVTAGALQWLERQRLVISSLFIPVITWNNC